jgi:site-specific recombinase XerD
MKSSRPSLAELLRGFFHERLAGQLQASGNTIKSYRDTMRLLLTFVASLHGKSPAKLELDDISLEAMLAFLDHLEETRSNTARSRNQRLAAIKAFAHHIAFADPESVAWSRRALEIPAKRFQRTMFTYLTKEEMDAVLAAPDLAQWEGRRDYALLSFMYNTGARVAEVIGLTESRLRLTSPCQVELIGKGGKHRIVPLWPATARTLEAWLEEAVALRKENEAVFVNARGRNLTRNGVNYILNQNVRKAAPSCLALAKKSISPHTIRHTTAMHLLQAGVDLNLIRCWLGHVSLDTTHQYVEADLEMKRKALEKGGITAADRAAPSWKPTDDVLAFLNSL